MTSRGLLLCALAACGTPSEPQPARAAAPAATESATPSDGRLAGLNLEPGAMDAGAPAPGRGGLTPEQVRSIVIAHVGAVRACYEVEASTNPQLKGGVTMTWRVEPEGRASQASVANSTLGSPRVEACIARQINSWRFPPSGTPTIIGGFPFKFGVVADGGAPDAG